MRALLLVGFALALVTAPAAGAPAKKKAPPFQPYYASIGAERAKMRTGPGRTFPAVWMYVRRNLPVRVVDKYDDWLKVEDPGGTQGWMLGSLVSRSRTGIVVGDTPAEMRDGVAGGTLLWRAAPGVVGRVNQCGNGWCRFDVRDQIGFVEQARLWGVDPRESLP